MRPRALSLSLLVSPTLLIASCLPFEPLYGGFHAEPAEAVKEALKGGSLGSFEEVEVLQSVSAPESQVCLYAGYDGHDWQVSLADAKQHWRGWWAHGMYGGILLPSSDGTFTCASATLAMGGSTWLVVAGHQAGEEGAAVELALGDGSRVQAALRPGLFGAMTDQRSNLVEVRMIDKAGHLVAALAGSDCHGATQSGTTSGRSAAPKVDGVMRLGDPGVSR